MVDKIKIVLAVGVRGRRRLAAYYWFADTALVLRVLMVLGGLIAAGVVAWTVGAGQGILRVRAGSVAGGRPSVVADAQGNDADHGDRVRRSW